MPAADDIARLADELRGGSAFRLPGLAPSLAVSLVAHALVVAVLLSLMRPLVSPVHILPVSLVDGPEGGGDGSAGTGSAPYAPPAAAPSAPAPAAPAPPRRPERLVRSAPPPPAVVDAPSAGTSDGAGTMPGTGDGAGAGPGGADGGRGAGGGGAGAAYGTNPLPPYPMVARRLGMEGRVELEVLVTADGRAADVRVRRSSGFAPLDTAAVTTVRERWRFVPARQGATAVESRVTVPIVFRLDGVETGEPRG